MIAENGTSLNTAIPKYDTTYRCALFLEMINSISKEQFEEKYTILTGRKINQNLWKKINKDYEISGRKKAK